MPSQTINYCRKEFEKCDRGRTDYFQRFNLDSWFSLKQSIKKKHRAKGCRECAKTPQYALLKHNNPYILEINKKEEARPVKLISQTCRRKHGITKKDVQKIQRDTFKLLREQSVPTNTTSLLASKISINAYQKLRIRMAAKYKKNPEKSHVGRLENYVFDENIILKRLQETAGSKMRGRWAALAREANVRKRPGLKVTATLKVGRVSFSISGFKTGH